MNHLNDLKAQARAVIPKILALVQGEDLDQEDLEEFEDALTRHVEHTNLRLDLDVPGHRVAAAVRCPFYAHETLAKHAGLATALERNGDRLLAQGLVGERGNVVIAVSSKYRELLTKSDDEGAPAWSRWLKQVNPEALAVLNSSRSLDNIDAMYPAVPDMVRSWISSMEPAIRFGLRVLPEKKIKQVMKQAAEKFEKPMAALLEGLKQDLMSQVSDRLDHTIIARLNAEMPIKTMGLYNYITRPVPAGVDPAIAERNRNQALTGYRNLVPMLADFHSATPAHTQLREAVDKGTKVQDLLVNLTQGDGATAVRAFMKADLGALGAAQSEISIHWLRNYVRSMTQFPVQRYPKTAEEIVFATELGSASEDLQAIANATGQKPMDLWEGLLKQGWRNASHTLAAAVVQDVPTEARELGGMAVGGFRVLREILEETRQCLSHFKPGEGDAYLQALLGGRGITRLLEAVRPFREVQAGLNNLPVPKAPDLPEGHQWSPLLAENPVIIDGVSFTEMHNETELEAEGNIMNHCVGGYAWRCKQSGFRIFKARLDGPRGAEHKGTLSIIINNTFNGHSLDQFRATRNSTVDERLQAASIRFRTEIDDGTIRADFDGFRRDKLRFAVKESAAEAIRQAQLRRMEAMSQGLTFLMPPKCAGQTLVEFTNSEYARTELQLQAQRAEAKLAQEEMAKLRTAEPAEAPAGFGFG